jgi:hypothetical protein
MTRFIAAMANRNSAETVVAMIPPTSRKAPKPARAVAVSATTIEAMAMIVAWPTANHRPTAIGRWPCCISLRVTLSIAAM